MKYGIENELNEITFTFYSEVIKSVDSSFKNTIFPEYPQTLPYRAALKTKCGTNPYFDSPCRQLLVIIKFECSASLNIYVNKWHCRNSLKIDLCVVIQ